MTDREKLQSIENLISWYRFDVDFNDNSRYQCFVEDLLKLLNFERQIDMTFKHLINRIKHLIQKEYVANHYACYRCPLLHQHKCNEIKYLELHGQECK